MSLSLEKNRIICDEELYGLLVTRFLQAECEARIICNESKPIQARACSECIYSV